MQQRVDQSAAARSAVQIELARPITGHKGLINVISLREITLGDWIDCGPVQRKVVRDPRMTDGYVTVESIDDREALMRWMIRLSGIDEAMIRTLSGVDGQAVAMETLALVAEFEAGNFKAAPTSSSSTAG